MRGQEMLSLFRCCVSRRQKDEVSGGLQQEEVCPRRWAGLDGPPNTEADDMALSVSALSLRLGRIVEIRSQSSGAV